MAALILGRLLTRPDMGVPLADFIAWSKGALQCTDAVQAPFLVPGVCVCIHVHACVRVFKRVRRGTGCRASLVFSPHLGRHVRGVP